MVIFVFTSSFFHINKDPDVNTLIEEDARVFPFDAHVSLEEFVTDENGLDVYDSDQDQDESDDEHNDDFQEGSEDEEHDDQTCVSCNIFTVHTLNHQIATYVLC